jgi:hypothetical protein
VGWRRGLERSERAGEQERSFGGARRQQASMEIWQGRAQAVQHHLAASKHAVCRRRSRQWRGSGRAVERGMGREGRVTEGRSRGKGKVRASASLAWLSCLACGPGGGTARV